MVQNIIFDLGGVLLNINFDETFAAFDRVRGVTDSDISELATTKSLFELPDIRRILQNYETGMISSEQFRDQMRTRVGMQISDAEFDEAWNALLLDFPAERIEVVQKLKAKYRTFLLSNTNAIHCQHYNQQLQDRFGIASLSHLLDHAFYSFEMNLRKPDPLIYYKMLKQAGIRADECLFIDDCEENLESAKRLGIQTILVSANYTVVDVFEGMGTGD